MAYDRTAAVPMEPVAITAIRHEAADWVRGWSVPIDAEVVELLVSELVTNSLLYGSPPCSLRVAWQEPTLRVEVMDADLQRPAVAPPGQPLLAHGRGLALVEALADDWGVDLRDDAKCVWFEMRQPLLASESAQGVSWQR